MIKKIFNRFFPHFFLTGCLTLFLWPPSLFSIENFANINSSNIAKKYSSEFAKSKAEIDIINRRERDIINDLNLTGKKLNKTRQISIKLKSGLAEIEKKLSESLNREKQLVNEILVSEIYVAKRLRALYRLNQLGQINFIAGAKSFYEIFQRKNSIEKILLQDEKVLKSLGDNKAELGRILGNLRKEKEKKSNIQRELNHQIERMGLQKKKREKILADIRSKKSLELAALNLLKESSGKLGRTLKGVGDSEKLRKSINLSGSNFADMKGALNMPVKGKIISWFGSHKNSHFNVVKFQSGINIKADRGEPIRAVGAGKTMFSSWLKGYGNLLVINHGNHYYTVYAHLEEIFKVKDETVEKGEVIATVGDTGSITGFGLHFEVRHYGKSLNPLIWIKKDKGVNL